ncbi:MAG: quercetin 2,3-dioxygenase [Chloroflexia bacterium]|nr:quercetin 2,3-dioxygenase [Chloroflexia bacterium]
MTATANAITAYARTQSSETSRWYHGGLITFLATGDDTNGQFSLIEYRASKGGEPPRHIHQNEEECFYILDGEFTFYIGEQVLSAPAGTWAIIPRGAVHTFSIETEQATALVFFTPSGFEDFFKEMSEPAESLTVPPAPLGPPNIARLVATAEKYGCQFV